MTRGLCFLALTSILLTASACENDAYLGVDPLPAVGGAAGNAAGFGGVSSTGGTGNGRGGQGGALPDPCPTAAFFCSSFEDPDLLATWSDWQRNGEVLLESVASPVRSGSRALHSRLTADGTNSRLIHEFDEPVFSSELSARVFFYIPSATPIDGPLIGVELKDPNSGGDNKVSLNWDENRSVRLVTTIGATSQATDSGTDVYDADRWNCALLRLNVADEGRAEIVINGRVVLSAEADTLPADGIGQFLPGSLRAGAEGPIDIYYDDVVIAQQRLSCPSVL